MREYKLVLTDDVTSLSCVIIVEDNVSYTEAIEDAYKLIDNCIGGKDIIRN